MEPTAGILFAFAALIFWGFGDFLIQRSTRKFGNWETLFFITLFGAIILTPFVLDDIINLFSFANADLWLLMIGSIVLFGAAMFEFEALKRGKIAVIAPVMAIEVPVAAILAFMFINESITMTQAVIISILLIGLVLVSLRSRKLTKKNWLERGIILALIGSTLMGASNFLVGFASRVTNPLITNWFLNVVAVVLCFIYLLLSNRLKSFFMDIKENPKLVLTVSVLDNLA